MRKMFFMAVSATLVLAAAVFCYEQANGSIRSLFNTEAQADDPPIEEEAEEDPPEEGDIDPAIITCSSGSWGRCFEKYWCTPPGHIFSQYSCVWTGYQKDYCPWWYLL